MTPCRAWHASGETGIFLHLTAFLAGTALQLQQPALLAPAVYALLGLLALVAGAFFAIKIKANRVLLAVAVAACAFGLAGWRASHFQQQGLDAALEGRDLQVAGIVASMPQRSDGGVRFRLDVEDARLAGSPVLLPAAIYLGWYGGALRHELDLLAETEPTPADLRAGERWRMTVRLKAPHGNANPHGFDYELWLWEQGLQATGTVRAGPRNPAPLRLSGTWQHPVEGLRQATRDAIFARVADPRVAGVIAALVVGDQNAIERADWDIFRATGVAHLMSISGLHVTMFAWAAALLVGWLWRRSARLCLAWPAVHAGLLGGMVLAGGYALFSGWGVPSQRTVIMLATVGLLRLSGRRWPWTMVLLLACAMVVLMDPWALLQAGFWLSFVAVGVLFATDSGAAQDQPAWTPGLSGRIRAMLHEQWVVTLALTPLSLLLFNQVSVVGLLANALAIPWVTLLVTPLAMAGALWAPLWDAAGWAVQLLGGFLRLLAGQPFATISIAAPPVWAATLGVLGGIFLAMRLPWRLRGLGLPLLLPVLLWQPLRPAAGEFELLAADIGQGNAAIVRTAGHSLLYDTGPRFSRDSDAGHRTLVPLLRALDEPLDMVLLSHRDSDHTGGARAVLAMQPQASLLSSIEDDHELQTLRRATRCAAGQHWRWDGVDFDILHPAAADYAAAARSNAMSCVLRVSNGRQTALLTGDIEQPQESRLVSAAAPLKADVLLVPHHGSKTSSSAGFLDAVQPRLAVVQSGYRNRFGHPAEPVMARYRERGIVVVDSPRCGAVLWASNQPAGVQCQREVARRYWHHTLEPGR